VGDHVPTLIAYAVIGVATAWWFWRANAGVLNPKGHAVVSAIFGLLWPVSMPWQELVRTVSRAIARRRMRRRGVPSDDPVLDKWLSGRQADP
jgi:hypothetical protein